MWFRSFSVLSVVSFVAMMFTSNSDFSLYFHETIYGQPGETSFEGKVVWITGGSSGIGQQLAIDFSSKGAHIILSARRKNELDRVKDDILKQPDNKARVHVLPLDQNDLESLDSVTSEAISLFGHIDIFVFNGGISMRSFALNFTMTDAKQMTNVNFLSGVQIVKALLPHMIERKTGQFVFMNSVVGKFPLPLRTIYSASKMALKGYADILRWEVAEHNINVLSIHPGAVVTNISKSAMLSHGKTLGTTDNVISKGLSVERASELMLTAINGKFNEVWVAQEFELLMLYLYEMFPSYTRDYIGPATFKRMVREFNEFIESTAQQ